MFTGLKSNQIRPSWTEDPLREKARTKDRIGPGPDQKNSDHIEADRIYFQMRLEQSLLAQLILAKIMLLSVLFTNSKEHQLTLILVLDQKINRKSQTHNKFYFILFSFKKIINHWSKLVD